MSILVSGGAGYIGSHTCVELLEAGYDIVVVARVKAAFATYRHLEWSFLSLADKLGLKAREAGEP